MSEIQRRVMMLIRDLLDVNESLILPGRNNKPQGDFNTNFIEVDTLGPDTPLAATEDYNKNTEIMTHNVNAFQVMTVDFFGDDAHLNAATFRVLMRSDKALQIAKTLGIGIKAVTSFINLRQLNGQQYENRVQVEFGVHYNSTVELNVLRIDTAQLEFLNSN